MIVWLYGLTLILLTLALLFLIVIRTNLDDLRFSIRFTWLLSLGCIFLSTILLCVNIIIEIVK